jgi:hypothetical protein
MLSSMNTRSSVTMLPEAPGANGQPPRPARQASNFADALFQPRQRVGQAQAHGVVQVQLGQPLADRVLHLAHRVADQGGCA